MNNNNHTFNASNAIIISNQPHDFIVCCFFTDNYKEHALALKESLDKFNLNYCLQPVDDRGYWEANTRIKPEFLLHCINEFTNKNLLYLDADAVVKKPLTYFDNIKDDLAIYCTNKNTEGMSHDFLTGTIYIKNNDLGKLLLEKWVKAQSNGKQTQVDQDSIEIAIDELKDKLSILSLPMAYIKIYDNDYQGEIYIEQFQASRGQTKLRRKRIRLRNQIIGILLLAVLCFVVFSFFR